MLARALNTTGTVVTLLLCAACKDDDRPPNTVASVKEPGKQIESMRASNSHRETAREARQRHLPNASEWRHGTPKEFLLPRSDFVRWKSAMTGATLESHADEQAKIGSEMTEMIGKSIWRELTAISPEPPYAYDKIHPIRAAWVLTWEAHVGIEFDGITGYFGNEAYEAPLAADRFVLYGMNDRATFIREAMSLWPDDQPLDVYPEPLTEEAMRRLLELQRQFWYVDDPYVVRVYFALEHPQYFFDIE